MSDGSLPPSPIQSNYPRQKRGTVSDPLPASSQDVYTIYRAYNSVFLAVLGMVPLMIANGISRFNENSGFEVLIFAVIGYLMIAGVYFWAFLQVSHLQTNAQWPYLVGAFILPIFGIIGLVVAASIVSDVMKKRGARLTQKKEVVALWNQKRAEEGLPEVKLSPFTNPYK